MTPKVAYRSAKGSLLHVKTLSFTLPFVTNCAPKGNEWQCFYHTFITNKTYHIDYQYNNKIQNSCVFSASTVFFFIQAIL